MSFMVNITLAPFFLFHLNLSSDAGTHYLLSPTALLLNKRCRCGLPSMLYRQYPCSDLSRLLPRRCRSELHDTSSMAPGDSRHGPQFYLLLASPRAEKESSLERTVKNIQRSIPTIAMLYSLCKMFLNQHLELTIARGDENIGDVTKQVKGCAVESFTYCLGLELTRQQGCFLGSDVWRPACGGLAASLVLMVREMRVLPYNRVRAQGNGRDWETRIEPCSSVSGLFPKVVSRGENRPVVIDTR